MMKKSDKPGATQRRIWRMTPEAPLGEFVDADKAEKPSAQPGPDELKPSSWVRSSWDLLNGLEVTESSPGELEALFGETPPAAPASPARERPQNAGEWIRRFALRFWPRRLRRSC